MHHGPETPTSRHTTARRGRCVSLLTGTRHGTVPKTLTAVQGSWLSKTEHGKTVRQGKREERCIGAYLCNLRDARRNRRLRQRSHVPKRNQSPASNGQRHEDTAEYGRSTTHDSLAASPVSTSCFQCRKHPFPGLLAQRPNASALALVSSLVVCSFVWLFVWLLVRLLAP